jgi:hypothetical protein
MSLTQKPISTISYNTENFLDRKLKELYDVHIIDYALYIKHKGENDVDDFTGEIITDKDHWHIYLHTSKRIDLTSIKKDFNEIDIENFNSKPLGCMNFQLSKIGHWLCYAVHKVEYLLIHKIEESKKQYTYKLKDIKTIGLIDGELESLWKQHARPLLITKQGMVYKKLGGTSEAYEFAINSVGTYSGTILNNQVNFENNINRYEKITKEQVKELEEI